MAVRSEVSLTSVKETFRFDAEFYQPEYLRFAAASAGGDLLSKCVDISHPTEITRVYEDSGIQILLAQNVRPNRLDFSNSVFMSSEFEPVLRRNLLKPGDVLMTRSGANFGETAVYRGEPSPIYACADVLILRPNGIAGGYISTYFNTIIGRALLTRGAYGAAQPHIAPNYLYRLRLPRVSESNELAIDALVEKAYTMQEDSKRAYAEAEALLLERLGFAPLDLAKGLASEVSFKEVLVARRYDAEHYQPKFRKIREHITNTGAWKYLGGVTIKCERGVQPDYTEGGATPVVNTKHLGRTGLVGLEDLEHTNGAFWYENASAQLEWGDALFYSTGAYIGRTNYYPYDQPAIGSNHVTIIRADQKQCDPVYLSIFLNSPVGLAQDRSVCTRLRPARDLSSRLCANLSFGCQNGMFRKRLLGKPRSRMTPAKRPKNCWNRPRRG